MIQAHALATAQYLECSQVFLSFGMIEKCSVVYSKRHSSTPSVTTDVNQEFIHVRNSESGLEKTRSYKSGRNG